MTLNLTARLAAPLLLVGSLVLLVFAGLLHIEGRQAASMRWSEALVELQGTVHEVGSRVQSGILTRSDEHAIAAAQAASRIDSRLQEAAAGRPELMPLLADFQAYFAGVVAVSSMYLENRIADGERRLGEVRQRQAAIDATVGGMRASAEQDNARLAMLARGFMLVAIGVLAAMVVTMVVFVRRRLVAPIQAVALHAASLTEGNADLRARIPGSDLREVGEIAQAFNALLDRLHRQFSEVRASADSIRLASGEIAAGNRDLSERTERTTISLQAASGDLAQLTGHVQHAAEAVNQAERKARDAAGVAERGGTLVAKVVSTMSDINSSSKRIADIVGVIDGIAFQTNLLALNAAVEAARAGEQGRGFAVVAAEVRALASRSAAAAKEIKALIEASVGRVDLGSREVEQAGTTMTEVVAAVRQVSALIAELSLAAADQRQSVENVSGSMNQLDASTSQNAALVEQSTAATESLRDQSERLNRLVADFRL